LKITPTNIKTLPMMVNAKLVSIFFSFVGIIGTGMIQSSPNLICQSSAKLVPPESIIHSLSGWLSTLFINEF